MANSKSFVQHALDLMEGLGPVDARRMFGGHGLYARGVMFALLAEDELFLKTDAQNRPTFVSAGCRAWIYDGRRGPQETSYFRPPDEAHEDPEAMLPWATLALEAALRKRAEGAKKPARPKRAVAGKGTAGRKNGTAGTHEPAARKSKTASTKRSTPPRSPRAR